MTLVAFAHTDLRIHWVARLSALHTFLAAHKAQLKAIEIAGSGSPYAFAHHRLPSNVDWKVLFPDRRMEDIGSRVAFHALWQHLESVQPDIVMAGAIAFPSGAAALHWCKARHRPVVIVDDARLEDVPRGGLTNWVKKRMYAQVDAILTSAANTNATFRTWGVPDERIFHGVTVVDNDAFVRQTDAARLSSDMHRQDLKLPAPFFLGVGRLVAKKNWSTLVSAYREYLNQNPATKWDLVLVGDGPDRHALEHQVSSMHLSERVHLPSFVTPDRLAPYYALAGALVLPSYYGETWGLVVNEAMAGGLPVIVSDQCGCASTLVKEGVNGWTFPPNDPVALTQSLSRMAGLSDAQRIQMGQHSRQIISGWGIPRFCQGAWDAIQQALARQSAPVPPLDRLLISIWKGRYRPT